MKAKMLKKQLALIISSAVMGAILIGCGGDAAGSGNTSQSRVIVVPQYPISTDYVRQKSEFVMNVKNERRRNKKLNSINGKFLQGSADHDAMVATSFLGVLTLEAPMIRFISLPAVFVDNIFNTSSGLDTELSDIVSALQNMQSEINNIESQITVLNIDIAQAFNYTAQSTFGIAASNYNQAQTAADDAFNGFAQGIENKSGGTWLPTVTESNPIYISPQGAPDVGKFNSTIAEFNTGVLDTLTGVLVQSDGLTDTISGAGPTNQFMTLLSSNYQLFITSTFNQQFGSLYSYNLVDNFAPYNQSVANYFWMGLKEIQYAYILQKTANMLNQSQKLGANQTTYSGPLSSINSLNYVYLAESINSPYNFESVQTNLDTWAIGAANQLYRNVMQYIISDTPISIESPPSWNPNLAYPYGAESSVQNYFRTVIIPSTIKTQSLMSPETINGGIPQIESATNLMAQSPAQSQFMLYVESSLGNPYQYIEQYLQAWQNGESYNIQNENVSIFATNSSGTVDGYIANPGYYDGQNFWLWTTDQWGQPVATAETNLVTRCNNNGSNIIPANDGGTFGGTYYPPQTFAWYCDAFSPGANLGEATAPLVGTQEPSNDIVLGLMNDQALYINDVFNAPVVGTTTITGGNTLHNDVSNWWSHSEPSSSAVYNLVMTVNNNYVFYPSYLIFVSSVGGPAGWQWSYRIACNIGDPLCTINPSNQTMCVAGNPVGLVWIDQGYAMLGIGNETVDGPHCYNSSGPQ